MIPAAFGPKHTADGCPFDASKNAISLALEESRERGLSNTQILQENVFRWLIPWLDGTILSQDRTGLPLKRHDHARGQSSNSAINWPTVVCL